jgi:hypothetical protein
LAQLPFRDRLLHELADPGAHALGSFQRVLVEFRIVELRLREREIVRDRFRGLPEEPGQALGQAVQRRERRAVSLAEPGEDVGVAARGVGGRGEQQGALRAESSDERGRRQPGLAGDVGEGQARRAQPPDCDERGAEDVFVAGGAGAGHDRIINANSVIGCY